MIEKNPGTIDATKLAVTGCSRFGKGAFVAGIMDNRIALIQGAFFCSDAISSWQLTIGVVADADALAAPQGRAEDISLAATWAASDRVVLRVGYRTVEGGADNDEVYNFTWLHSQ